MVRTKPIKRGRPALPNGDQRKAVWARLNTELHHKMKIQAAVEGRPLAQLMDDAMRLYLETQIQMQQNPIRRRISR